MRRARGLSLLEAVVVLAIVITVLATSLPILLALLREQKGLAGEILRGESFPLVHGRLDRDLGAAKALTVAVQDEPPAVILSLTPRLEGAATVVWRLGAELSRQLVPADGSTPGDPRVWKIEGSLAFLPTELSGGRIGFLWSPLGGQQEIVVFETPRADEELR